MRRGAAVAGVLVFVALVVLFVVVEANATSETPCAPAPIELKAT